MNVDQVTAALKANDEIGLIAQKLLAVMNKVRDFIAEVKTTSSENASISHELSTTALRVGSNVENSVVIVEDAVQTAKEIQEEIGTSITTAQESQQDVIKANENLETAKDASEVKTILVVIVRMTLKRATKRGAHPATPLRDIFCNTILA